MIVYFSATGNSKYVANYIAERLHDRALSILECGDRLLLREKEKFGIVSPTYVLRLPSIMEEFLKKVQIEGTEDTYTFFIATYGTTSGNTGKQAEKLLASKGLFLRAKYSIRMVDNWTPGFDLTVPGRVEHYLAGERPQMDRIVRQIRQGDSGDFMETQKHPCPLTVSHIAYDVTRRTAHFWVRDSCVGCGLCARQCPVKAIELKDGRPTWTLNRCVMCLGCLHRCPKFAIQYGKNTLSHGQYLHP